MSVKVRFPTHLRAYAGKQSVVEVPGATLAEVMAELDNRFPGVRFRIIDEQDQIRDHIKLFVNQRQAYRLDAPLQPGDEVRIIAALSGG